MSVQEKARREKAQIKREKAQVSIDSFYRAIESTKIELGIEVVHNDEEECETEDLRLEYGQGIGWDD